MAPRESSRPSQMTRERLEALVVGICDHRIAAVEERLAELERKTTAMLPSYDGGAVSHVQQDR